MASLTIVVRLELRLLGECEMTKHMRGKVKLRTMVIVRWTDGQPVKVSLYGQRMLARGWFPGRTS